MSYDGIWWVKLRFLKGEGVNGIVVSAGIESKERCEIEERISQG